MVNIKLMKIITPWVFISCFFSIFCCFTEQCDAHALEENNNGDAQVVSVQQQAQQEYIALIEKFFNTLWSIKAEFHQQNSDGMVQSGTLYISRPNKMRWEYKYPDRFDIVINHSIIMHYRYDLDELSYISLNSSPLKKFCQENVNFSENVIISDITQQNNNLSITFIDTTIKESPQISLVFSYDTTDTTNKTLHLQKFSIQNRETYNTTDIIFNNITALHTINEKLFEIKKPNTK